MKIISTILISVLLAVTGSTCASVVVGGTRLVYDGGKKEASLSVSNLDKTPYLIQSWVENSPNSSEKAPFIITPPLFRLEGEQENVLRVVRSSGNLPVDRESMYWINIKSIPSLTSDSPQNTLQIAVKTRIKLIYRPQGLQGSPEEQTEKLIWQRKGNNLQLINPTPFYMNFHQVKVGESELEGVAYVAPMSINSFTLPKVTAGQVSWKIINDYGGVGPEHVRAW
ncbi:molecular chaperone [Salmonella enterica]|nr:molecular chaperone [Salmonella enterica subsp. enterica serovar Sandiego]EEK2576829.1 molecular chaperone [Salmonella enterica subsp. enterica serovar Montevideo]